MRSIVSIQALRAVAAIAVVLCHFDNLRLMILGRPNDPFPLYPLASGVDLFFVISGFIMVYSSEQLFAEPGAWKTFLTRRIARIVPPYWVATALAIPMMSLPYDWASLAGSYLFVPYRVPNDNIVPLHGVGWTLNFEMFFYCLFALAIWLPRNIAVAALSAGLCLIVLLGHLFPTRIAPLAFWSDPLVLEFVVGMAIAMLYRQQVRLPIPLRAALILAGAVAIWFWSARMPPSGYRVLEWGIPAAMMLSGAVLGVEIKFGRATPAVEVLGGASYALYLIHPLMTVVILKLWQHGLNRFPLIFALALGVVASVIISVVVFLYFEKRTTKLTLGLLGAGRAA